MANETQNDSNAEIVARLQGLKERMAPGASKTKVDTAASGLNPWRAAAVVAVAALSGVAIWLAYNSGSEGDEPVAPAVIRADTSPTKVPPDDPGGLDVADQDMLIFDRLKNGQVEYEEQLLPPPEEPVEIIRETPVPEKPAVVAEDPKIEPAPVAEIAAVEEPVSEPVVALPTPPPPPAPLPKPDSTVQYSVQLAALASEAAAETAWKTYADELPGLLARHAHYVARLDRPGKTPFYRLRVGTFTGRQDAVQFCNALKREGQDCMVVTR